MEVSHGAMHTTLRSPQARLFPFPLQQLDHAAAQGDVRDISFRLNVMAKAKAAMLRVVVTLHSLILAPALVNRPNAIVT